MTLTAAIEPTNATDKTVKWSVGGTDAGAVKLYSDAECTNEIGTDATETLTVYAKGISAGSATVTCTSNADSNKSASCDVTVNKANPTAPTGLTATYGQTLANVTLPDGWTWADSTQSVGNVVDPAATFKANFAGNDNYNAASNVDVTVTVGKADPTAPTGLTATYGQTLANVTLPDGWTWADSTQSVGSVVSPAATFKANFAGNDNYNAASNVDVTVTVGKADPTAPTGLTATYGQTLANVTLPDGWTWADSTQSVGNVVDPAATFKANFVGDDNHNAASDVDVTVTVGKADPTAPTGLTATYGQTLANVTLPDGWTWADSTQSVGNVVDPAATFKANFAGNDNYKAASNVDVSVTIGKANAVAATVTANSRTYDGTEKPLVTVTGEATGGEMQYALGNATEATQPYTTSIPTATNVGTYYVWYMVKGDDNHANTDPARVKDAISINPVDKTELNAAIASAEEYYDSIKDNAAYADIAATLKKAIDAAKAVAGNDNVTKETVSGMLSEVDTAASKAKDDVAAVDKKAADEEAAKKAAEEEAAKKAAEEEAAKQAAEEEAAKKAAEEEAAKQATDEAAAKAVTDKINALPENAGAGDKAAVEEARRAYDALTEDQKKLVPGDALSRLAAAEQQVAAAGEASETVKISDCKIRVKNLAYTGKRIKKPTVTVTYNGQKLKEGTDYTFTYNKKAKAIGAYKVTVKGKGRFTGSKKVTLKVVPKGTAFSKVAGGDKRVFLKWKSQKNITGYQIDYSLKKDFSDRKRVTIKKAGTLTQTPTKIIKKLKAGTTYYVRIRTYTRVKKKSYYSAWSKVKTVKTKAGMAGNESVEPEVETGIDGGDLSLEIDEISIDEISIDEAIPGDGGTVDGGEVIVDEAVEVTVE